MKENEKSNLGVFVVLVALGSLAGYLTGILTAKKPGKELREDIKNQTEKSVRQLKENCSKAEEVISRFKSDAWKKYNEFSQGEKFNIAKQINQIFNRQKSEV